MSSPRPIAARALTARERDVIAHAELGRSNKLIAYALRLAPSTVSTLLVRARKKLGARAAARGMSLNAHLLAERLSLPLVLESPAAHVLTTSERAVIALTLQRLTNAAIARQRRCSPRTVANQLAVAYRKLAVGSRRELYVKFGGGAGGPP